MLHGFVYNILRLCVCRKLWELPVRTSDWVKPVACGMFNRRARAMMLPALLASVLLVVVEVHM